MEQDVGFSGLSVWMNGPSVTLATDFTILDVSDAYRNAIGLPDGEMAGRPFVQSIGDMFIGADDSAAANLHRSLEKVLETGQPNVMVLVSGMKPRSAVRPDGGGGWNAANLPLTDTAGRVVGLLHLLLGPVGADSGNGSGFKAGTGRPVTKPDATAEVVELGESRETAEVRTAAAEAYLLRQIVGNAPGFMAFLRGPRHVFELVNDAFSILVRHRPVIGRPFADVFPELSSASSCLRQVFESGSAQTSREERLILRPHGREGRTELFLNYVCHPIRDIRGNVLGVLLQGQDLTEKKQAETALCSINHRWESALEGAGDGVWDWDIRTNHVFYSRRWKEMLGLGETDIDNDYEAWRSRVHPDDIEDAEASLRSCLQGDRASYVSEHRAMHRDGRWLHCLARAKVCEWDESGAPTRMIGTYTDMSEMRRLTEKLRQSHELLQDLSEQVPGTLFQFRRAADGRSAFPFASRGLVDTHEVLPADVVHDSTPIFQTIEPEDMEGVLESFEQSANTLEPWNHEFRMRLPRQGLCWRHGIAKPKRMDDGSIVWHGFITDITQRKQAEAEIARLALVAQKITTGVTITDRTGAIEWVNPAFTDMTGYTLDEVIGHVPGRLLAGPNTAASATAIMRDAIVHGVGFTVDVLNYHKSGRQFWQHIKADPVFDDKGHLQHFIAVQTDISEKKKSDDFIWKQANYDALTGLPNRRLFRDRLDQEMRKAHRTGQSMALLFIDLDHFKEANDLLGHDGGDVLLRLAADRISSSMRESDTVARLGGDEFTVILGALDHMGSVDAIAEKILDAMRQPFVVQGETFLLSASIGVAMYPMDALLSGDLLKHADQAMYAAKARGRNQFSHFTFEMHREAEERYHLSMDLRDALSQRQLAVNFQPVVCMKTGRIVKAEALARWHHPRHGPIEPTRFIPVAEENGTIHEIGEWVFLQAAQWSRRWSALLGETFQISVNKSPVQFLSETAGLSWPAVLKEMEMAPDSISIEITEGVLLNASGVVTGRLLHYRDEGMQVALDDFGTGYSSMLYLKKFDIDYLKIDQSFIQDMPTDGGSRTIAETIIMMAHKLGMRVIAEGIETAEQQRMLGEAGCDLGQGYLFSPPLPPEQFERLLLARQGLSESAGEPALPQVEE